MATTIGIDFSINSPAVCIFRDGKYRFIGFHQYKTVRQDIVWYGSSIISHVKMLRHPALDLGKGFMNNIVMADMIISNIGCSDINSDAKIFIEDYNYNPKANRNNIIDVVEATMVLKHEIYKHSGVIPEVCSIPVIKKAIAGKGSALKPEIMVEFRKAMVSELHLDSMLRTFAGIVPDRIIDKKTWDDNPYQDIVDAWAVCQYGILRGNDGSNN